MRGISLLNIDNFLTSHCARSESRSGSFQEGELFVRQENDYALGNLGGNNYDVCYYKEE